MSTPERSTSPPPNAGEPDDHALVRRVVDGDHAAFEQMMRRYNRRLYRLARATLKDDAEAEDALQEAYLSAYRSIAQFREDASLFTWLARIVLNECFARLRRDARRENVVPIAASFHDLDTDAMPDHDSETPDQIAMRSELRTLLERKLDRLPEAFRTVFVLRAVEELSVEETARLLQVPEATVRSRLFRARALLRESLAHDIDVAERDIFQFAGARCDRIVASVLSRLER